jgi:aminoglycoside phosphotransferase (APT) family kinase protein
MAELKRLQADLAAEKPGAGVRAVGRRLPFDQVPESVRAWVTGLVGTVTVAQEHRGGMSPGCATSLRTEDGRLVFVKAVGAEQNPQTLELFRYETRVLHALPAVPYRPALLASHDRDGWAALLLEHVEGRHPDLSDPADHQAVAAVVAAQVDELSPPPPGSTAPSLAETARRWAARWVEIEADPAGYLPHWAAERIGTLVPRVRRLPERLDSGTLSHFDLRDDNLLIRTDGSAAVIDWGMARLGPGWVDPLLLALQQDTARAVDHVRRLDRADQETAVDLLVAFAGSQAWNARQPARPGLPHFATYCADDAARLHAAHRPFT